MKTWMRWLAILLLVLPVAVLADGLPFTDGHKLPPEPVRPNNLLTKASDYLFGDSRCDTGCVTKFDTLLGEADGAKAYSNCKSTCFTPEYSFLNLKTLQVSVHKEDPKDSNMVYIGVVHQCVEYARKWWMINEGISFPSIDYAYQIFYLKNGFDIRSKAKFPLARSINGSASIAPKRGDLLIYAPNFDDPDWRAGHVAVITRVDLKQGELLVAEENYNNKMWQAPKYYARKIQLTKTAEGYKVLDLAPGETASADSGSILGWVYPQHAR